MIAPPRPVVDSDRRWRREARRSPSPDDAQQRVFADWNHQPARESGSGPPAKSKRQMVHDMIEPLGASRPRGDGARFEALGEYPSDAELRGTTEAPDDDNQLDRPARHGQIRQSSRIPAMDSTRDCPTLGT